MRPCMYPVHLLHFKNGPNDKILADAMSNPYDTTLLLTKSPQDYIEITPRLYKPNAFVLPLRPQ